MTMAEKKAMSIEKEIEKLTKSLERYQGIYEKKNELCVKLECDWSNEEMRAHRGVDMTDKQWGAWFDRCVAEGNVQDTQKRLDNAFGRLEKANIQLEKVQERIEEDEMISSKELSWLEARQMKEEEYYKWLAEFKADCLKDGIIIENAYADYITGTTRGGKRFSMYINGGWTERSFHSYTLRVDGSVYFTSGLFSTGYKYLMTR